jgi:hypothetical protein
VSIKCQKGLPRRKNGLLTADGATAHRLPIRAKSGSLAGREKRKASVRCAAGSLSFFGQKKVTKVRAFPPTEQTKDRCRYGDFPTRQSLARSENDAHPCASPSGSAIGISAHTGLKSEKQSADAVQFRTLPRQTRPHQFTKTLKRKGNQKKAHPRRLRTTEQGQKHRRPTNSMTDAHSAKFPPKKTRTALQGSTDLFHW